MPARSRKRRRRVAQELPEGDEVDKFHERRDKIMLNKDDDDEEEEDDAQEAILDLDIGSSSDSDDYDENYEKMMAEDDEEKFQARREQLLKEEKMAEKAWKNNEFYGADTSMYEVESDEEIAEQEEEAAISMQKKQAEDLEEEYDGIMEDLLASGKRLKKREADQADAAAAAAKLHSELNDMAFLGDAGVTPETVDRDLSKLSKEEKLEILETEAPELVGLLEDLQEHVQQMIDLPSSPARLASACYAVNLAFYLLLKSTDSQAIKEHPVMGRLARFQQIAEAAKESMSNKLPRGTSNGIAKKSDARQTQSTEKKVKKTKKSAKLEETPKASSVKKKKKKKKAKISAKKTSRKSDGMEDYFMQLGKAPAEDDRGASEHPGVGGIPADGESEFANDEFDEDEFAFMEMMQRAQEAKEKGKLKKEAKKAGPKKPKGIFLQPEDPDKIHQDGRRKAAKKILKNRGLTRVRNKKYRTPHLRARHKYDKAMKKRRDQVRDFKGSEAARYVGEKTGIKANIIKSTKIKL
uniref:Sas10 C-terminal domain-containing protein n=1 Tax=Lotharella globosa TaxID=91324 RepID=A0A7S3Z293_9EUKA|mmetsp:Transcript_17717/g.35739  ORF Transcript_17717/g.35739 Transcript_17717/m.35739 type:complete len:523 (-) Transcript_17717:124-1692(-)